MTTNIFHCPQAAQGVSFACDLRNSFRAWRLRRQKRRAVQQLRGLNNHALKDIGLHRSEIMSLVHTSGKDRRRCYARA